MPPWVWLPPAQKSSPESEVPPAQTPSGREQAGGGMGAAHHHAACLVLSEPAIPVPRRCPAARCEAPGTHPRGLELLPHVAVPGAPLVPVRGWEGDVTLAWERRHRGGTGPVSLPVPTAATVWGESPWGVMVPVWGSHRWLAPLAPLTFPVLACSQDAEPRDLPQGACMVQAKSPRLLAPRTGLCQDRASLCAGGGTGRGLWGPWVPLSWWGEHCPCPRTH